MNLQQSSASDEDIRVYSYLIVTFTFLFSLPFFYSSSSAFSFSLSLSFSFSFFFFLLLFLFILLIQTKPLHLYKEYDSTKNTLSSRSLLHHRSMWFCTVIFIFYCLNTRQKNKEINYSINKELIEYKDIIDKCTSSPKLFFNYINSKTKTRDQISAIRQ